MTFVSPTCQRAQRVRVTAPDQRS